MDMEFNSLQELYNRLKPALQTKQSELNRLGYKYIKEEDIWNHLKETKWKSANNLLLYQMVDDIINVDALELDDYLKEKLLKTKREVNLEGEL